MNKKNLLMFVVLLIIVGAGCFYGGTIYSKGARTTGRDLNPEMLAARIASGEARGMGAGRVAMPGALNGEIVSKDQTSAVIKLLDGGSKIILFSSSTQVSKTTEGDLQDLKIGENIFVNGQENQDGSLTAQFIQIRAANFANFNR